MLLIATILLLTQAGASSYLPFLDIEPDFNNTVTNLSPFSLHVAFPSYINFGNYTYNSCNITSKGLIKFGKLANSEQKNESLVAPFWTRDSSGTVTYDILTKANTSGVLGQVNDFISNSQTISFDADWMLVVKWIDVGENFTHINEIGNTFQAIVASQGTLTYTVFTYQCDNIKWGLGDLSFYASVGFSSGNNFFETHPLSNKANVTNIDCINQPHSIWSNVVYKLSKDSPVCTNTTCLHNGICVPSPDSEFGFQCDCTGTLYTGKRCNRGFIQISLSVVQNNIVVLTLTANPEVSISINFGTSTNHYYCNAGGGPIVLLGGTCPLVITKSINSASARILTLFAGVHSISFSVTGPNANSFITPEPLRIYIEENTNECVKALYTLGNCTSFCHRIPGYSRCHCTIEFHKISGLCQSKYLFLKFIINIHKNVVNLEIVFVLKVVTIPFTITRVHVLMDTNLQRTDLNVKVYISNTCIL
jgi:hypothetical protein